MTDWIQVEQRTGAPIEDAHGRTIVPVARAVIVRLPGSAGGLVWNRPVEVRVEEPDRARRLPVHDVTRQVQFRLLGLAAAWLALVLLLRWRRRGA
jgi:hypothetical protein